MRKVTIKDGRHHRVTLYPKRGTLLIRCKPQALLTLDGRRRGKTRLEPIKLFEGPHVVVLENRQIGASAGRRIVITAGKQKVLDIKLEPRKRRRR